MLEKVIELEELVSKEIKGNLHICVTSDTYNGIHRTFVEIFDNDTGAMLDIFPNFIDDKETSYTCEFFRNGNQENAETRKIKNLHELISFIKM